MAQAELVERAKELVEQLSRTSRFAGSPEEAAACAVCRTELERAGFVCTERPFEYSEWPGRWGPPIAAATQTATIFVVARTAMHQGPLAALIVGGVLFIGLLLASGDAKRRWISVFPFQRAKSANLEARRGNPSVWLIAHLDSKSQTVPMLIRIASSIALGLTAVATAAAVLLSLVGVVTGSSIWPWLELAAIIAALPSILCWVGNESNGAVDNASGVAAVLLAAQSASSATALGVLITSGEELGLAGSRIWAARAQPGIIALNCDTVDDVGGWHCMYSGTKPKRIGAAVETVAGSAGFKVAVGRLIPGIMADSMAFSDRGIEAVTVSRGSLSTLARVHTRRDTSTALTGSGVAQASALLTALAKELA